MGHCSHYGEHSYWKLWPKFTLTRITVFSLAIYKTHSSLCSCKERKNIVPFSVPAGHSRACDMNTWTIISNNFWTQCVCKMNKCERFKIIVCRYLLKRFGNSRKYSKSLQSQYWRPLHAIPFLTCFYFYFQMMASVPMVGYEQICEHTEHIPHKNNTEQPTPNPKEHKRVQWWCIYMVGNATVSQKLCNILPLCTSIKCRYITNLFAFFFIIPIICKNSFSGHSMVLIGNKMPWIFSLFVTNELINEKNKFPSLFSSLSLAEDWAFSSR